MFLKVKDSTRAPILVRLGGTLSRTGSQFEPISEPNRKSFSLPGKRTPRVHTFMALSPLKNSLAASSFSPLPAKSHSQTDWRFNLFFTFTNDR